MKRSIWRQIWGSFLAVVSGWLAALIAWFVIQPHMGFGGLIIASWFMWLFILPTWLVIFMPLYLLVPRSSPLWKWPVCTILGVIAGALILGAVVGFSFRHTSLSDWIFLSLAATVGGVTCLTASLTSTYFKCIQPGLTIR